MSFNYRNEGDYEYQTSLSCIYEQMECSSDYEDEHPSHTSLKNDLSSRGTLYYKKSKKRNQGGNGIEKCGYRSDESCSSDDYYNAENQSQFSEKSPSSVLDWLQPRIQGGNDRKRREDKNQMLDINLEKKLQTRKQNEAIHRAMKMSPDKCLLHEEQGVNRTKYSVRTETSLFDDVSHGSIGSGASSVFTTAKPSIANSLMAHLLQMNKEKQDEIKSNRDRINDTNSRRNVQDTDEEMLQQLLACKTPSIPSKEDEERLTQFEVITPCFLAFGLISIILMLILFFIPWKHNGLPPQLPEMPSSLPSISLQVPSMTPVNTYSADTFQQQS